MRSEEAGALVAALGHAIGIPALALDSKGGCRLRFDGTEVMLEAEPEEQRLVLHADIGTAPALGREAVFGRLLEANLLWKDTGGATFAFDPRSGRLLLMQAVPDGTAPARFPDLVARFVDVAEAWTAQLGGLSDPAAAAAPDGPVDPSRYV